MAVHTDGTVISLGDLPVISPCALQDNWHLQVIGQGGFGQVYKARHLQWGRDVAIKMIFTDDLSRNDEELNREAGLTLRGECPYVVMVLGIFRGRIPHPTIVCDHVGMVTELMERGSLETLQKKLNRLPPWSLVFRLVHQVALGMKYLHSLSPPLIHRDLKPGNVLLDQGLNVKITDFGIAKFLSTVTGEHMGTPLFMPPEACGKCPHECTIYHDVYSYAILVWTILNTGQELEPYDVLSGERPPLKDIKDKEMQDQGQGELGKLMVRCWNQDPYKRPNFPACAAETEGLYEKHKLAIHDAVDQVQKELGGVLDGGFEKRLQDDPGRYLLHPGVVCDGCTERIRGTRYKCTVCPDYDLCSRCQSSGFHKEHRLRSIQFPFQILAPDVSCDGCKGGIWGTRYKCTVCPDYEQCSRCQSSGFHKEHRLSTDRKEFLKQCIAVTEGLYEKNRHGINDGYDAVCQVLNELDQQRANAVEQAQVLYVQRMKSVRFPTNTLEELSAIHASSEREALELFLKQKHSFSFRDYDQEYQKKLVSVLQGEYNQICEKNFNESRKACERIIKQVFKPLEDNLEAGLYRVPGGYETFCQDLQMMTDKYNHAEGRGVKAVEVLKTYLDEMAVTDNALKLLSEAQRRAEEAVEQAQVLYVQRMKSVRFPTNTLEELSAIHASSVREALELFMKHSLRDDNQEYQKKLVSVLQGEYNQICEKNFNESRKACERIIKQVFKPLEDNLEAGLYRVPGGYETFCQDLQMMTDKYNHAEGRGVKAVEVLKTYLDEMAGTDNALKLFSEAQRRAEEDGYPDIKMNVKFVQDTSKYWYKPDITKEQANNVLKDREPGAFIIRDSLSLPGAYGLAMKVACPPPTAQQNKKVPDITDLLVRHFLIENSAEGFRLKGDRNAPFDCLSALLYQHSMTPVYLPCKLMIPITDERTGQYKLILGTDDRYKFTSKTTGLCVIINNEDFNPPRKGTDADADKLAHTFTWLGFKVLMCKDKTKNQMLNILGSFSSLKSLPELQKSNVKKWSGTDWYTDLNDLPHHGDAFVCCILSHGKSEGVCGTDGETIPTRDIIDPFNSSNCPALHNKPKLFFIQACRESGGQKRDVNTDRALEKINIQPIPTHSLPVYCDYLIGFSTINKYAAAREDDGTWYIKTLCNQLEYGCTRGYDIHRILTRVTDEVCKLEGFSNGELFKQTPDSMNTLRRLLVFRPI